VKGWVIPPEKSSEFVANMERVLDVYKRPYNPRNPVICMDELFIPVILTPHSGHTDPPSFEGDF